MVDTDLAVSVTSEKVGSVSRPSKGDAVRGLSMLSDNEVNSELIHHLLRLKIPDLDRRGGCSHQPVSVWRENEGVNDVPGLEGVEAFALGQVPQDGDGVLSTRGTERPVGRYGDGVKVTSVAEEAHLEGGEVPYLDNLVPSSRDEDRSSGRGREPDTGDPVRVTFGKGLKLAFSKSIPNLDVVVAGSRNNLTIVNREGDGQHVLGVTLIACKAAGASAGFNFP